MKQHKKVIKVLEKEKPNGQSDMDLYSKQISEEIKTYWRSLERPDNKIYIDNELLIGSVFSRCLAIIEKVANNKKNIKNNG
jgi:hypothetical protein